MCVCVCVCVCVTSRRLACKLKSFFHTAIETGEVEPVWGVYMVLNNSITVNGSLILLLYRA